jgi:acetylglutamate kinase
LAVAAALTADRLVFLSDVPGVLEAGKVVPEMSPREAEGRISAGIIHGGMIPKVRSAVGALAQGIGGVVIGAYRERGDLSRLLGKKIGTLIRGDRS